MYAPISWIREFVAADADVETIARRLTTAGIEVDGVRRVGVANPRVVAARILNLQASPSLPGLLALQLDVGAETPLDVVSRAPNLTADSEGRWVAVALDGATVFSSRLGGGPEDVQAGTSHGLRSEGMLLSERELGIGDRHGGVLFLPEMTPGGRLDRYLQDVLRHEAVLDIAILPNIARCLAIVGIAREIAAVMDLPPPADPKLAAIEELCGAPSSPEGTPDLDPALCNRLSTALVTGLEVRESPIEVQQRLRLCGVEPINNIVDASNYVMLELGQPTHAYDAARLASLDLTVRGAAPGERFQPLTQEDGEPAELPEGAVVVDAGGEAVALAGVVGGRATAIDRATQSVLLESANFSPIAIRRSQAVTKQHTSASMRFTRAVDPALTMPAIGRIVQILRQTCPNLAVEWVRDQSLGREALTRSIRLSVVEVNDSLGSNLDAEQCRQILRRLGLSVEILAGGDALDIVVDSAREDLQGPADLVEEIARIHGFDALPATFPADAVAGTGRGGAVDGRELARAALVEAGLREVITYSLTSTEVEQNLLAGDPAAPAPAHVRLINPQSVERSVLRRSLLPELLLCVARNQRHAAGCHIFEIGSIYLPDAPGPAPTLPAQPTRIALAMSGPLNPAGLNVGAGGEAGFFDAVAAIELLGRRLLVPRLSLARVNQPPFQANACAVVRVGQQVLGHVGVVHPRVARAFGLAGSVVAADLDLQALLNSAGGPVAVREIPRFPVTTFDLSFVVPEDQAAGELSEAAGEALGDWLQDLAVFDVYRGPGVAEGFKAVGLRFAVAAATHAVTSDEGRQLSEQVVATLSQRFGAALRQ
jgi:phenylalanyl-tRNA synthetase beta chain